MPDSQHLPKNPRRASAPLAQALLQRANADGVMSFATFSEIALFAPGLGYYATDRRRVGLSPEADFYTASSVGPVFGQLVATAAAHLIAPAQPQAYTLVEIGAEPGQGVFGKLQTHANAPTDSAAPAFGDILTLPLGSAWHWPQHAVIFANELLDAQPFHRLQYRDGHWCEWGVRCEADGSLSEILLPQLSPEVQVQLASELPANMPEGYRLDISLAAETLLARLLDLPWQGALLLFDYGRPWAELLTACPGGTARAYRRHTLSDDLLAHPAEQDLTCHVCWDRIRRVIEAHGFADCKLERQEAFFMYNSMTAIAAIIEKDPAHFDPDRQALMSLLHPTHLGSKFQVMHARRLPTA